MWKCIERYVKEWEYKKLFDGGKIAECLCDDFLKNTDWDAICVMFLKTLIRNAKAALSHICPKLVQNEME